MLNPHFPWLNPHEFGFTVLSKGPPAIPSRLMGSWAMAEAKALLRLETAESMRPKALGVSINGGTPKNGGWFIVGNPIKMDDLGVPYFRKPPYIYTYICVCMYMYIYMCIYIYIYVCIYMYVYVCVCALNWRISIIVLMCICICVYMYTLVSIDLWYLCLLIHIPAVFTMVIYRHVYLPWLNLNDVENQWFP